MPHSQSFLRSPSSILSIPSLFSLTCSIISVIRGKSKYDSAFQPTAVVYMFVMQVIMHVNCTGDSCKHLNSSADKEQQL